MNRLLAPIFLLACRDTDPKIFNSSPSVAITSHPDATAIWAGYSVEFGAQASDPDDLPADLEVAWSANGEQICGWAAPDEEGLSSCSYDPVAGALELLARVRDPLGFEGERLHILEVLESQGPSVEILLPAVDGIYYSDRKVPMEGRFSDGEDLLEELSGFWYSSETGALPVDADPDSGGVAMGSAYLPAGEHKIRLVVQDPAGNTGVDEVEIVVGPPNTAPTCEILSPFDGEAFAGGQPVELSGIVADPDIPLSLLAVEWHSDKDGLLGESVIGSGGGAVLQATSLSSALHSVSLRVKDETGATCADEILVAVSSPPEASIDSPVDGEDVTLGDAVDFRGALSDEEDQASLLTAEWESSLDGLFHTSAPDSAGEVSFTYAGLSAGEHSIVLTARDSVGLGTSVAISLRVNTPPPQPSVSLSPDPVYTEDDLAVAAAGDPDADGDSVSYSYQWWRDGQPTGLSGSTLSASETQKGEHWRVEATPSDGYDTGPAGAASLVVSNTPPSVTVVALLPVQAYNRTLLVCSGVSADPDEVPDEVYRWSLAGSGSPLGLGAELQLSPGLASPEDEVVCTYQATDSDGGSAEGSASVVLSNTAPAIALVEIIPNPPTTSSLVQCGCSVSDDDADSLSTELVWTNATQGTELGTGATLQLEPGLVSPGDELVCSAVSSDPWGGSAEDEASVPVGNSPPVISSLEILPGGDLYNTDTLLCAAEIGDGDGETLDVVYSWENITQGTLLGTGEEVALDGTIAVGGDVILCTLTATDPTGDFDSATAMVSLNNSPPAFQAEAAISPLSGIRVGETLTCSATVVEPDGQGFELDYVWTNLETGQELGIDDSLLLVSSAVQPGDVLSCTVSATDAYSESSYSEAFATVENSPPEIQSHSVGFSPAIPYATDEILLTATAEDADGDPVSISYLWYVDGALYYDSGSTLPAGLPRGTEIYVEIVPNDGREDGAAYVTSVFEIENFPPTAPVLALLPELPKENQEDLVCGVAQDSVDHDGDTVVYAIEWFVNGIGWAGTPQQTHIQDDTVPGAETEEGQRWHCEVTPTDLVDEGVVGVSDERVVQRNCYVAECDYPIQGMDFLGQSSGIFFMGSMEDEPGHDSDETLHIVSLSRGFDMMTTEVSQLHFAERMGYAPSAYSACGYNCPVENITWSEAAAFANEVSEDEGLESCYSCTGAEGSVLCETAAAFLGQGDTGTEGLSVVDCQGYRLPTEAEWEYAARAGSMAGFWTGNGGSDVPNDQKNDCTVGLALEDGTVLGGIGRYCATAGTSNSVGYGPQAIAELQVNGFGLFDMHGNVWEWCHDWYVETPETTVIEYTDTGTESVIVHSEEPVGPDSGSAHSIRGGSYADEPRFLRSAERRPGSSVESIGFRLVRTVE
jgi:formylglycine-generating enzyme required for sulfatase activity